MRRHHSNESNRPAQRDDAAHHNRRGNDKSRLGAKDIHSSADGDVIADRKQVQFARKVHDSDDPRHDERENAGYGAETYNLQPAHQPTQDAERAG